MKGIVYVQDTGEIAFINGDFECPFGSGFAGTGEGRNDSAQEHVRNIGPIPRGDYYMEVVVHPRFHAPAIKLTPEPETQTFGRSSFYIHGGTKSEGCIILSKNERLFVEAGINAGFRSLRVVAQTFF